MTNHERIHRKWIGAHKLPRSLVVEKPRIELEPEGQLISRMRSVFTTNRARQRSSFSWKFKRAVHRLKGREYINRWKDYSLFGRFAEAALYFVLPKCPQAYCEESAGLHLQIQTRKERQGDTARVLASSTMMSSAGYFSPLSSFPRYPGEIFAASTTNLRERFPRIERNCLPNKVREHVPLAVESGERRLG